MQRVGRIALAGSVVWAALAAGPAAGQRAADRADIWDIALGGNVADIDPLAFQELACGTDGGPPSTPLAGWGDFLACPAEANGLREVQFRYDDELEYVALALEQGARAERWAGTKVAGAPAIVSVLIDEDGVIQGLRVVTDDRAGVALRTGAYGFRYNFKSRFGLDGWACVDRPPGQGREPVGDQFVDERCEKHQDGLHLVVEGQFFRRPGQAAFDPRSRELTPGEFHSSARLEVYREPYGPPGPAVGKP